MKILLHVGMSKCGSSALQTFLSTPGFRKLTGDKYIYVAVKNNRLLIEAEVFENAKRNQHGYTPSDPIILNDDRGSDSVLSSLKRLGKRFNTVVMSCEGWMEQAKSFEQSDLFNNPDFEVEVLAYVRPNVEWLNSAWWQWGAWEGGEFEDWRACQNFCVPEVMR